MFVEKSSALVSGGCAVECEQSTEPAPEAGRRGNHDQDDHDNNGRSYPSLQGNTLTTRSGVDITGVRLYDPFGQPLYPMTSALGTASADGSRSANGL